MSCRNCHCSPCSCHTEIRVTAPQVQVLHMGTPDCCPIKGWYETLPITSWTPPAAGETTQVATCDATRFPVGTCALVSDGTNKRVLKVTGWNNAKDAIYLKGYDNAEAVGGSMAGNINLFPLALCPVETQVGGVVCDRDYMVTAEAFVMPVSMNSGGGSTELVWDIPQTLQLGMSIYVVGAGYMEITTPPGGTFVACGTSFYAFNRGTAGNSAAGTTISVGAAAYPEVPENGAGAAANSTGLKIAYGNNDDFATFNAPFVDSALEISLDVDVDEMVEVLGTANFVSPNCFARIKLTSGSASWIGGVDTDMGGDIRDNAHAAYLFKASAAGTLKFRWECGNGSMGVCTGEIKFRSIIAKVLGVV